MLAITLEKAKTFFNREFGNCLSSEELADKIAIAIEYALTRGGGKIVREWVVLARDGYATLPRDLKTPVKYKIGDSSQIGAFRSIYHTYSSNVYTSGSSYIAWDSAAMQPNKTGTQFRIPPYGARLVATTHNQQDINKKIMINGSQREMTISPTHQGHKTSGELLTVYHHNDTEKKYSAYLFNNVTSVIKDPTTDYVILSAIDSAGKTYHLSKYHPDETAIEYNEVRFLPAPSGDVCIHILGRVDQNIIYTRDEDVIPIDSLGMLELLAKRSKYLANANFNELQAINVAITETIENTIRYQEATIKQLDWNLGTSGMSYTNI